MRIDQWELSLLKTYGKGKFHYYSYLNWLESVQLTFLEKFSCYVSWKRFLNNKTFKTWTMGGYDHPYDMAWI